MADISDECSAVVEGKTEVLRLLKGEPVTIFSVFAEGVALLSCAGVDKVNDKILTLASDETDWVR